MKINKKILIPMFATSMGLAAIGGVSGAVAWYQYNTKAEASWIGASVADGGSLLISKDNGTSWDRSIIFGSDNNAKTLHPVTFPSFDGVSAPSGAKKHPEYGVEDSSLWKNGVLGTDYYQYTFKLKAEKIVNNEYVGYACNVKIKEFVLDTVESAKSDAAKAVRVHFASDNGSKLYSLEGGTTTTHGSLDLNGDDQADYHGGYAWDTDFDDVYSYGGTSGSYESTALVNDVAFLSLPAEGLSITVTIWWEGWHSFASNDMSMWDPEDTGGANIRLGLTFGVEGSDFIAD